MDDIEDFIKRASCSETDGRARMKAVHVLKSASLSTRDAESLCGFLEKADDPNHRAAAAQVLGHHRKAGSDPEILGHLIERSTRERDPGVLKAIAFALRGRDEVCRLLEHPRPEVSLEAVFGAPLTGRSLKGLLGHFFHCRDGAQKAKIATRFQGVGTAVLREIVEYLHSAELPDGGGIAADLEILLETFPQEDIFPIVAEKEGDINGLQNGRSSGFKDRSRRRMVMEVYRKVVLDSPSLDLLIVLLRRLRDEESFYHENVRFLRQIFGKVMTRDCRSLLAWFKKLGKERRGSPVLRMAEILSIVSRAHPNIRGEANILLKAWAQETPEVNLRIYHLRLQTARGVG